MDGDSQPRDRRGCGAMFGDSGMARSFSFSVKRGKGNCRIRSCLGIAAIAVDED
jgi:hypothetical protein